MSMIQPNQCLAQKTDTIVHINGNILTGDFKKMNYGVVTWKMDGMGTIDLEEPKIQTIISSKMFEIKMIKVFPQMRNIWYVITQKIIEEDLIQTHKLLCVVYRFHYLKY